MRDHISRGCVAVKPGAITISPGHIKISIDRKRYPNGRFAPLYGSEGNAIELWESKNPKPRIAAKGAKQNA
jgi:hypothetical protein